MYGHAKVLLLSPEGEVEALLLLLPVGRQIVGLTALHEQLSKRRHLRALSCSRLAVTAGTSAIAITAPHREMLKSAYQTL